MISLKKVPVSRSEGGGPPLDRSTVRTRAPLTLAVLLWAGCAAIGEGPSGPKEERDVNNATGTGATENGEGASDSPEGGRITVPEATDTGTALPLGTPCADLAAQSKEILKVNCTSCHGSQSQGKGGFNNVLDAAGLVQNGRIKPNAPDESKLYLRLSKGTMPPSTPDTLPRPSEEQVSTIRDWILCGAPDWDNLPGPQTAFLSIDARLDLMLGDLRSFATQTERQRIRYIDLSHLSNAGFSTQQINEYREGVSLLVNSLSFGSAVVPPPSIDSNKLIYRVDLRQYGWNAATWDQISTDYPYLVRYDQNSSSLPYDEATAAEIRRETGTIAPFLQGDWLIAHGSQAPLYYQVLNLSGRTLNGIAGVLGVNIDNNIRNGEAPRAGFTASKVSVNNRVIERHELPASRGAFWLSYDFASNIGTSDIHANPLDFQEAGGEAIFNLPNGLQAYLIVNNVGNLIDKVPNDIATDPNSRTREVGVGASCMGCHNPNGIIEATDTVRLAASQNLVDPREREAALELYVTRDIMEGLMVNDQRRYGEARREAAITNFGADSMSRLVNGHEGNLAIGVIAGTLGIETAVLQDALVTSPRLFPDEILTVATPGGSISRSGFEAIVDDIILALGLGAQISARPVRR